MEFDLSDVLESRYWDGVKVIRFVWIPWLENSDRVLRIDERKYFIVGLLADANKGRGSCIVAFRNGAIEFNVVFVQDQLLAAR